MESTDEFQSDYQEIKDKLVKMEPKEENKLMEKEDKVALLKIEKEEMKRAITIAKQYHKIMSSNMEYSIWWLVFRHDFVKSGRFNDYEFLCT